MLVIQKLNGVHIGELKYTISASVVYDYIAGEYSSFAWMINLLTIVHDYFIMEGYKMQLL